MSLCLQTMKGNVNLVSAHAPTLGASLDVKDSFTVRPMDVDELLFILRDFSARVENERIHLPRALG